MSSVKHIISALFTICLVIGIDSAKLSSTFYSTTCPQALLTVRTAVTSAVTAEARMGASLLNLHFHDCFVTGCDASILLDDTTSIYREKTAAPNLNLRGFEVIDNIKVTLENLCPGVVSCADILALAARDSVLALGGPNWKVALGRRDSSTASLRSVGFNIPTHDLNLPDLITRFANKGFTAKELVALSGAHTIGRAKCTTFRNRLYNDANLNTMYAAVILPKCPETGGSRTLWPLDVTTPTKFDNAYFKNLLTQRSLLHSDQALFNNGSTDARVRAYASNPTTFFNDFANAMVKMGNLSPLTGTDTQIRTDCRRPN